MADERYADLAARVLRLEAQRDQLGSDEVEYIIRVKRNGEVRFTLRMRNAESVYPENFRQAHECYLADGITGAKVIIKPAN